MGMRDMIVEDTIMHFVERRNLNPSTTDIRLVSNEIGDDFVYREEMTLPQWERISQDRTIALVKAGLKKERGSRAY